MNEKTIIYILVVGAAVLGILGFFSGRWSGRTGLEDTLSDLERDVEAAIGERDAALSITERLGENIDTLGSQFEGFTAELDELNESFHAGIQQLDGTVEANKQLYNEYIKRYKTTEGKAEQFRDILDRGLEFIGETESTIPPGSD